MSKNMFLAKMLSDVCEEGGRQYSNMKIIETIWIERQ